MYHKKLSLIVPLYNVAAYAAKAAFSIRSQAFEGLEVVLVDDGSTDYSLERFREYLGNVDVVTVRQENAGPGGARNTGIRNASGEFLMFLDGDDFLLPKAFERILTALAKENPDILFGRYRLWTEKKGLSPAKEVAAAPPKTPKERTAYLLGGQPEASWCPVRYLCRRAFVLEHHIFFETDALCEDVKWSIDLLIAAEHFGGEIAFLSEPFYAYNHRRPGSTMNTYTVKRLLDLNNVIIKLLEDFKDRPELCRILIWESFFYINEYCLFKREDRKKIMKGYLNVLPLYQRSDVLVHRVAGKLNNRILFYGMSAGLLSVKMVRRAWIHMLWLMKNKPRIEIPAYADFEEATPAFDPDAQRKPEAALR